MFGSTWPLQGGSCFSVRPEVMSLQSLACWSRMALQLRQSDTLSLNSGHTPASQQFVAPNLDVDNLVRDPGKA